MGAVYASVADVRLLRPLTAQEIEQAPTLLENASVKLRQAAREYGYDLDGLIAADTSGDYAVLVKAVTVQAVIRAFNSISDNTPPAVQSSQAAMGYSLSMTWLNSGQSLYFLRNELDELGFLRQRYGALEVYNLGNQPT